MELSALKGHQDGGGVLTLVRRLDRGDPLVLQRILGSKVEGRDSEMHPETSRLPRLSPWGRSCRLLSPNLSFSSIKWAWEPCPSLAGCQLAWAGAGLGA